jgi:hypothetical protein
MTTIFMAYPPLSKPRVSSSAAEDQSYYRVIRNAFGISTLTPDWSVKAHDDHYHVRYWQVTREGHTDEHRNAYECSE